MLSIIRSLKSMEAIKEELNKCSKAELLSIANELQLTGVKSMSKTKLVEFIATTQKYRIENQLISTIDIKADWQK